MPYQRELSFKGTLKNLIFLKFLWYLKRNINCKFVKQISSVRRSGWLKWIGGALLQCVGISWNWTTAIRRLLVREVSCLKKTSQQLEDSEKANQLSMRAFHTIDGVTLHHNAIIAHGALKSKFELLKSRKLSIRSKRAFVVWSLTNRGYSMNLNSFKGIAFQFENFRAFGPDRISHR